MDSSLNSHEMCEQRCRLLAGFSHALRPASDSMAYLKNETPAAVTYSAADSWRWHDGPVNEVAWLTLRLSGFCSSPGKVPPKKTSTYTTSGGAKSESTAPSKLPTWAASVRINSEHLEQEISPWLFVLWCFIFIFRCRVGSITIRHMYIIYIYFFSSCTHACTTGNIEIHRIIMTIWKHTHKIVPFVQNVVKMIRLGGTTLFFLLFFFFFKGDNTTVHWTTRWMAPASFCHVLFFFFLLLLLWS